MSGTSPAGSDTLYANLEAKLDALDAGERTRIIVQLDAPVTDARIADLERAVGSLQITRRFSIIDGFAASASREQIEALARAPGVDQVESDPVVRGTNDKAQAAFGVSKARFDLPSLDGAGVAVAVLDSGVDPAHPDLDEGKVIAFIDRSLNEGSTPYDDNGHGTHVAAIVAGDGDASGGQFRGVAPEASIVGVKVLDANLSGSATSVIAGIEWVMRNRNRFGVPIRVMVLTLQDQFAGCSDGKDSVSEAVNEAHADGMLVVIAAGNNGPGACSIGAPAAAASAITVGAMADTSENGFRLADFSSRGPTLDGRIKPDLVAPGVGITSAWPFPQGSYRALTGTSQAAPFVAGVAALMLDANPGLAPQQVKELLMSTAVDWGRGGDNVAAGSSGLDIDYGAGRLDAYAAIAAAGAGLTAPPPVPAHEVHQGTVSGTGAFVDHLVHVSDTSYPLAATLIVPQAARPDLDLALSDPAGTEVASARHIGTRQEQLWFQPTASGVYTLRVSSRSGGGTYFVDVSGATSSSPKSSGAPSISGAAREGEVLRAQVGVWSGGLPLSYAYQWFRCDGAGSLCSPIPGAVGSEYQLGAADVDATLRLNVAATNTAGSATATSAQTAPIAPLPPRSIVPPSIIGTPRDGSTLHVERGSWLSSRAVTLTHQWLRCRGTGGGCTDVEGATGTTFGLGPGDIGSTITVTVTASNAGGAQSETATPVAVGARRPEIAALPVITGRAQTGVILHAEEGRWEGTKPLDYQLRWQRCGYDGRRCETIKDVVGPRYYVRPGDAGRRLRVRVRADNRGLPGGGATFAYSRVTRIVQPAASWYEAGAGRVAVLTGTRGRDVIIGTAGPDIIRGLGGNDRILGRGGNDLIMGGPGPDVLLGGPGEDDLRGGDGDDTLRGGSGADFLSGGRGKDVAKTVGSKDRLTAIERIR